MGTLKLKSQHRLLCGDSTKADAVDKLMGEQLADLYWTDPPYNVNYKQLLTGPSKRHLKNNVQKVENYIANDNMSNEAFYQFLYDVYVVALGAIKPGGVCYVTHGDSERLNFTKAFKDAGFYFAQALIWVKNCGTLCRSDFNWQHEPILYGWKPGAAHYFCNNFCLTSVIDDDVDPDKLEKKELLAIVKQIREQQPQTTIRINRPTKSELHPTMKPISLIQRCIEWSSKPGEIVLDTFGGSGSTLIACEKTGRISYTIELDPGYCDVIVERWEQFTGKKAVLYGEA